MHRIRESQIICGTGSGHGGTDPLCVALGGKELSHPPYHCHPKRRELGRGWLQLGRHAHSLARPPLDSLRLG